jgi:hypothetical protein
MNLKRTQTNFCTILVLRITDSGLEQRIKVLVWVGPPGRSVNATEAPERGPGVDRHCLTPPVGGDTRLRGRFAPQDEKLPFFLRKLFVLASVRSGFWSV